jgi:hypothetical protein
VRANASVALFVAGEARAGVHAWGVLPMEPGFVYDLDGLGGREGPDIRVSRNQLNLSNGALVARVGTQPTREQCARTRLSTGAVTLQDGRFFCVQTSERRLSALTVEGQNLRFETFTPPLPARR